MTFKYLRPVKLGELNFDTKEPAFDPTGLIILVSNSPQFIRLKCNNVLK